MNSPTSQAVLSIAERSVVAYGQTTEGVLGALRQMPLEDFAELMIGLPDARYPGLSSVLPSMASPEIQLAYTGSHGKVLLKESLAFVRQLLALWASFGEGSLERAHVLDFGCGYGRLIRLMLHEIEPSRLCGCDPWDEAIEHCRAARLPVDLRVTPYLPDTLPYPLGSFDLAYAFSVLTHTSERATRAALRALLPLMRPRGLLVVTIRPESYWDIHAPISESERTLLKAAHALRGFAYKPHQRQPIDGDVTYGDTSMTIEALKSLAPGWAILQDRVMPESPFQRVVCLRPAASAGS